MARRKVILPNWSANEADSKSIEMLGAEFSGLTQGELVINTNVDNTLLSTLNGDGKVVVFESSEMIDKRLKGFLDEVHQHDNKDILDSITSGRTDAWDKTESNARTYTDQQIDFIVSGASEAFDTLKEVEYWINNHSGETKDIIENINSLYVSAHTHSNKTLLDTYAQTETNLADAVAKKHEHVNKTVLDVITTDRVASWDAAQANVIEEIKVNNSALTISSKSVNIDLKYLEEAIEEIELTPGPQGVPGSAATITGATATIGTNGGDTPTVTVNSTGTDMARGFNFVFDNLKGEKGDGGAAAVFTAVTATISNNSGTPKVTVVSAGTSTVGLEFNFSGLKGEQGPQGEKGANGTSINILGSFDSEDGLNGITNPKNGDAYIINGYLYVWNGTKWENVGQIKGPQGDDGKDGITPIFSSATATITNTTGTPKVSITSAATDSVYSLNFEFSGLKGDSGDDGQDGVTPIFSSATANVTNTTGTPKVSITSASTGSVYSLDFAFSGLKGEKGDSGDDGQDGSSAYVMGATAKVDTSTGTPNVIVTSGGTHSNITFDFAFSGLKGADGKDGKNGKDGKDGTSVTIKGSVDSESDLKNISSPENGDGYIIGEDLWVWNGTEWKNVGKVKGPQGDPGTNAYITGVTASVGNTTGTPSVDVTTAGTSSNISFNLAFNGLKGEPGDDGENGVGINSFVKTSGNGAAGTTDTYTITFTNGVTSAITVYNGSNGTNGEDGEDGKDGITPIFTNIDATIGYNSGLPSVTVTSGVSNNAYSLIFNFDGLKGEQGEQGNIGGKGEDGITPIFSAVTASVNNTIGTPQVNITSAKTADNQYYSLDFSFSGLKGEDGANGIGINSFVKTNGNGAAGTTDTYTITFTNNVSSAITVYNGSDGVDGAPGTPGTNGSTWYNGITAPTTGTGVNGDWYLNTLTWDIYHKESNSWIPKGNIKGETGFFDDSELLNYALKSEIPDVTSKVDKVSGKGLSSNDFTNDLKTKLDGIAAGAEVNVQSDWNATSGDAFILNKPSLATVATSGSYNDLNNKPTLFSGSYNDLSDTPTLFSGDYNDLSNKPTIPSVDGFIKNISLATSTETLYIVGSTSKTGSTTSLNTSSTDVYISRGEVYATSDERLKDFGDNVEVDFNELSEIPKVYYSWKDDEEKRQMIGTSAQKLKEIYPELVSENKNGKMAVSYEKLSIIALAAVDKLHKENEELKDRLKRIEEKLGL